MALAEKNQSRSLFKSDLCFSCVISSLTYSILWSEVQILCWHCVEYKYVVINRVHAKIVRFKQRSKQEISVFSPFTKKWFLTMLLSSVHAYGLEWVGTLISVYNLVVSMLILLILNYKHLFNREGGGCRSYLVNRLKHITGPVHKIRNVTYFVNTVTRRLLF